jgi:hypothetical protein
MKNGNINSHTKKSFTCTVVQQKKSGHSFRVLRRVATVSGFSEEWTQFQGSQKSGHSFRVLSGLSLLLSLHLYKELNKFDKIFSEAFRRQDKKGHKSGGR